MSTENIEFHFIDEEESCKNSKQDSNLALTELKNINRNEIPVNGLNEKRKDKEENVIHNIKEIKKNPRNKISPKNEIDPTGGDVAATLLDQDNSATELLEVQEVDDDGDVVHSKKSPKKTDHIVEKIQNVEEKINSFFRREWEAFKSEKKKKLRQIPKKVTTIPWKERDWRLV